jgi:hypothetical protein
LLQWTREAVGLLVEDDGAEVVWDVVKAEKFLEKIVKRPLEGGWERYTIVTAEIVKTKRQRRRVEVVSYHAASITEDSLPQVTTLTLSSTAYCGTTDISIARSCTL